MAEKKKPSVAGSNGAAKKKVVGRPFKKGQSGNPTGRTRKSREIEEIVQLMLDGGTSGNIAADCMYDIMCNPKSKGADRINAGKVLLEYGFGKPWARVKVATDKDVEFKAVVMKVVPRTDIEYVADDVETDD